MSYKQYIPDIDEEWDDYWKKTSFKKELELVETDGLLPLFKKYLSKKDRTLEAGCGLGKWVIYLSQKGYNITGVDNNKYALKKLNTEYPQVKTKLANVTKLPYKNNYFDAYLSLGVVEHFEEGPQIALKEAYRVLKKSGLAIVEVPFDSPLRQVNRMLTRVIIFIKTPIRILLESVGVRKKRSPINLKFYEYRYTKTELYEFMKKAGFSEIKILPKDDLSGKRSISLWLDFPSLQKTKGKIFELNNKGIIIKKMLALLSPFTFPALVVVLAKKP